MELRKINPVALSLIGGCFIFLVTYILFWVLFLCLDSPNASREAIDILGSYFGGITTLWAAIIAAYLFNDWRDQHNKIIEYDYIKDIFKLVRQNHIKIKAYNDEVIREYLSYSNEDCYKRVIIVRKDISSFLKYAEELEFLVNEYHLISKDNETYLFYLKYKFFLNEFLEVLSVLRRIEIESGDQMNALNDFKRVSVPEAYTASHTTYIIYELPLHDIVAELEFKHADLINHIADKKVIAK